jgi:hypothetical protein
MSLISFAQGSAKCEGASAGPEHQCQDASRGYYPAPAYSNPYYNSGYAPDSITVWLFAACAELQPTSLRHGDRDEPRPERVSRRRRSAAGCLRKPVLRRLPYPHRAVLIANRRLGSAWELHRLAGASVCAPLSWSRCPFATQPDARPRETIAQGDPDRSTRGLERVAKRRCHSS